MQPRTLQEYFAIARAFIMAKSNGRLYIPASLKSELMGLVSEFAKAHKIRVELVEASLERTQRFKWGGALLGASIGYGIASVSGAVAGGVIGYCVGACAAKVRISIAPMPNGDFVFDISSN